MGLLRESCYVALPRRIRRNRKRSNLPRLGARFNVDCEAGQRVGGWWRCGEFECAEHAASLAAKLASTEALQWAIGWRRAALCGKPWIPVRFAETAISFGRHARLHAG